MTDTIRRDRLLDLFNRRAPIARTFGSTLAFDEAGSAILEQPYNAALDHALAGIHGGVIATLLDNAGWFTAALAAGGDAWVATSDLTVQMLSHAQRVDLRARGEILKTGRRMIVCRMTVEDAAGRLVAHGTGTFVVLPGVSIDELALPPVDR